MNIAMNNTETSLEQMFQRMGGLLKDIAAARNGLADDLHEQNRFQKASEPGVGEQLDLTA